MHLGNTRTRWGALALLAAIACQGKTTDGRSREEGDRRPTEPAEPGDAAALAAAGSDTTDASVPLPLSGLDECPPGQTGRELPACSGYRCQDSEQRVQKRDVCDGVADCPLGDDEPCSAPVAACPPQAEIVSQWLMDQSVCTIGTLGPRWTGSAVTSTFCESGEGLFERMICDGVADCASGEDEAGCPITCSDGECAMPCADGATKVPLDAVCDGAPDCPGGEDEPCVDRFQCDRELSVPFEQVCDGTTDCPDGRDEDDCPPPFFLCADGSQIIFPFYRQGGPGLCTLPQCDDESDIICINPP